MKIGDKVKWVSSGTGKVGIVTHVVPPARMPSEIGVKIDAAGMTRDHESYIVRGQHARPYGRPVKSNYWPRVSLLERVEAPSASTTEPFQNRVKPWMDACFGAEISADIVERNHRFIEEALELVQATGCTQSEAHQLVDYVYGRDQGDINQEVGGVMVTLAALCLARGLDMHEAGETELVRIWTKVETIRAKQAAKPKHSPLPA